jgi:hypothetical protein
MSFGIKASIRTGAVPVRAGVGTLGIGGTRTFAGGGASEDPSAACPFVNCAALARRLAQAREDYNNAVIALGGAGNLGWGELSGDVVGDLRDEAAEALALITRLSAKEAECC